MKEKKEIVRKMFDEISQHYDFINHFLSFGIDRKWRKEMIRILAARHPETILDVATGTADLAIAMTEAHPRKITGIDISEKMLGLADEKITAAGLGDLISLLPGDAEALPFPDDTFDAVTVAFGVRNFENLRLGLMEMKRVLHPGGILLILEFSHPASFPVRPCYQVYSRLIIPLFGRLISHHPEAYHYLPDSVASFPSGNSFMTILDDLGLKNTGRKSLTMGIASIYWAEK